MNRSSRWVMPAAILVCAASAPAQEPPAPAEKQGPLGAIQSKPSLTEEDRSAVRGWISPHIDTITSGPADAAATAVVELRREYKGTPGYKEVYAALCIEAVGGAYKSANLAPATQLLGVLAALNETPAYKVFIEATADARPAVRAAGVAGLRGLRQKLAQSGGGFYSETVEALRTMGKKETSPVGLRLTYQALNFPEVVPNVPDAKLLATAVVDILDTRSEQYASKAVKGEGTDHVGLALASSLKASLSDADREKLILIGGRMMLYAVHRYVNELVSVTDKSSSPVQVEARDATEMLIDESEKLLTDILKPSGVPSLSKAMRDRHEDITARMSEIRKAMHAWGDLLKTKTGQKFELDEPRGG